MHNKYNLKTVKALVVVSAKEHGKIYTLENGELKGLSYTEEHAPTYTDNEGFFTRSTGGVQLGSGNVLETNDEHNLQQYIKAISEELSAVVAEHSPEVVFVIEPEHLKGHIKANIVTGTNMAVEEIAYGNYVEKDADVIFDLVRSALTEEKDPSDPASVAGEEDAEEKRRILEIGKQVSG
ncbi:hypothetical protein KJ848_01055 [Patescibacteria group bacterium]|nr:hypothetical protein [Patescibacteria group bacterium]MBU2158754.1 hypothetical protein [Patescibacteria group bacterium]